MRFTPKREAKTAVGFLPLIYAGMMELVDMRDLGVVTSVKKFAINQVKAGSSCFYRRGSSATLRLGHPLSE